jgi:hypothetical protein
VTSNDAPQILFETDRDDAPVDAAVLDAALAELLLSLADSDGQMPVIDVGDS